MDTTTQDPEYKVGQLAKRTGLTVRTLHHYDEIGLLRPSTRTRAGHRIYGPDDVARLQRISSLRQLGLSLTEIAEVLEGDSGSMAVVLSRQAEFIRQRITSEERLLQRVEALLDRLKDGSELSTEHLLETIALTTMFEKYYSQEQLNELEARAEAVGPERMNAAQNEWTALHEAMDEARSRGLAPESPEVQILARRAMELIGEFTGGDAGISESLATMVQEERPAMHELWGITEELGEFYTKAMSALGAS